MWDKGYSYRDVFEVSGVARDATHFRGFGVHDLGLRAQDAGGFFSFQVRKAATYSAGSGVRPSEFWARHSGSIGFECV